MPDPAQTRKRRRQHEGDSMMMDFSQFLAHSNKSAWQSENRLARWGIPASSAQVVK